MISMQIVSNYITQKMLYNSLNSQVRRCHLHTKSTMPDKKHIIRYTSTWPVRSTGSNFINEKAYSVYSVRRQDNPLYMVLWDLTVDMDRVPYSVSHKVVERYLFTEGHVRSTGSNFINEKAYSVYSVRRQDNPLYTVLWDLMVDVDRVPYSVSHKVGERDQFTEKLSNNGRNQERFLFTEELSSFPARSRTTPALTAAHVTTSIWCGGSHAAVSSRRTITEGENIIAWE